MLELSQTWPLAWITSDFRPWAWHGHLDLCTRCGTVQKRPDAAWHQAVEDIYASYDPYPQGARIEQAIFAPDGTAPRTRSQVILTRLIAAETLRTTGRMLDIGCGNGALLRSFGRLRPDWRLNGADLGTTFAQEIRMLPGVEDFHPADPTRVAGPFDLMTMCHVLEHIPDPSVALHGWTSLLAAAGGMLVEVPDLARNPFDLVIVDHISHFTKATLARTLARSGLHAKLLADDWVAKELVAYAVPAPANSTHAPSTEIAEARDRVERQLLWLNTLLDAARKACSNGRFGIFGTAIGGTWLQVSLDGTADFFVDEDPNRIGGHHLGKPILALSDVPTDATVAVPLPPPAATAVAARLAARGIATVLPPASW